MLSSRYLQFFKQLNDKGSIIWITSAGQWPTATSQVQFHLAKSTFLPTHLLFQISKPTVLLEFVRYLNRVLHQEIPHAVLIWYDSVTIHGTLNWQNGLTEKNRQVFFDRQIRQCLEQVYLFIKKNVCATGHILTHVMASSPTIRGTRETWKIALSQLVIASMICTSGLTSGVGTSLVVANSIHRR